MSQDIQPETVSVGVARTDISPPVGIPSSGFAARGALTALHDPLFATALVVCDGEKGAALLACDLLDLDADTVSEIRKEVHKGTGIPESHVTVTCTHTHYGPDSHRDLSVPQVRAYRANLIHLLGGLVAAAASKQRPAHLGVGWGESGIGINRREKRPDGTVVLGNNPQGPIDRAVGVLRADGVAGAPIACLVNFQTHPVSQTGSVSHISADYVGHMRKVVESLTGATCLFLQGACGNINPILMEPEYEPARTLGTRLGCEVVRVWEAIGTQPAPGVDVASARVRLPRIRYGSQEGAEALLCALEGEIERLTSQNAFENLVRWAEKRLSRVRDAVESWATGRVLEPVEAELQAWRIGADFAMATAPGEIFNQIGVHVKAASPFAHTFFVGYANDSIGYVPVPEVYAEGGYEVTHASQVDPEAAGMITDGCLRLLRELM
jgi:neutral ceramidase